MIIYLEEPIKLHGIEVRHTAEGLKYLVDHYEQVLAIATARQLGDQERQHIEVMLTNYKLHIELYQKH